MNSYANRLFVDLEEKWYYEFDFLKEMPLFNAYLLMLGMAKNSNHLDRLHQALPENARLLRGDWIRLSNLWKRFFDGPVAKKFRTELEVWLLKEQSINRKEILPGTIGVCSRLDATLYYISQISKGVESRLSERYLPNVVNRPIRILSCPERKGHGYEHFQAKLFGIILDLGFSLYGNSGQVQASFVIRQRELTEKLTSQITGLRSKYYITEWGGTTRDGMVKNITFEVGARELMQFIEPLEDDLVARDGFLSSAVDLLRENGVPIEGDLSPILIARSPEPNEES